MPIAVSLFETTAYAPGVFDTYFYGLYLLKGTPLVLQLLLLALYPFSFLFAYVASKTENDSICRKWKCCAELSALLALSLSSLLLFQPWDELFTNLRHALHWAEENRFSFNRYTNTEGIVDFLVYFLMGNLAKLGIPLLEMAHAQSLLGAMGCAYAAKKLLQHWKVPNATYYAVPTVCAFAPLMLNSAHGFATTVFTANILWAIYFLCFTKKRNLGLFLVSLVPLIRMEGAWFALLFLTYDFYVHRNANAVLCLIPICLLTLLRIFVYGQAIPAPVHYKACFGNLFYSLMGVRNLLADLVAGYGFLALTSLGAIFALDRSALKRNREILIPLALLLVFVLPYYPSGGDWFPSAWGRYLFPLTLYAVLAAGAMVTQLSPSFQRPLLIFILSALAFQSLASFTAYPKTVELLFNARRALAPQDLKKKILRLTYRTHYLSQLGLHLQKSTQSQDVIASSELATIMYFAKRETLDTLGLTNPEIYRQPLRPTPNLIRVHPREAELPYLIFKRLNPQIVGVHRPAFLYTFDFMVEELLDGGRPNSSFSYDELNPALLSLAVTRWEQKFRGLVNPLYGGMETILKLGYHPIVIRYGNDFCTLYFVSDEKFEEHSKTLRHIGFAQSSFIAG